MNSLWLEKNSIENFSTLDKNIESEICIIGGGIFGISTAYYLSKYGYKVVFIVSGIEFQNQAQFNPIKYISGLVNKIKENKGLIFENTTCYDIKKEGNGYICYTKNNEIKAKYVVIATQYPFINFPGIYFAKMYQSSSYVIGIDTKTKLFDGMYINIQSPIYSFRTGIDDGKEILLLGGLDHKTGENIEYKDSYGLLEEKAKGWYPNCEIKYQ